MAGVLLWRPGMLALRVGTARRNQSREPSRDREAMPFRDAFVPFSSDVTDVVWEKCECFTSEHCTSLSTSFLDIRYL